jgi:PAS domain S-box-containing protein
MRRNWINIEKVSLEERETASLVARSESWTLADAVETVLLALGTSLLCLFFSWQPTQREIATWPLWGMQLLFVVWACLRQGLRGGLIVAAASGSLPLLARQFWPRPDDTVLSIAYLQAHLYAQATTALLIAAAAAWARTHETAYRQIAAYVPVVIYSARWRADQPYPEVTLVSAASEPILGQSPEQLLGDYNRWLAGVLTEDREVLRAAINQLTRQEKPVVCEYRLRPDGLGSWRSGEAIPSKVRWVRDTLVPVRDAEGNLLGWEGVVTEITEQRLISDDLRRTTSMFNALVGNLPTGVFFVSGPHGLPLVVNPRARQLLGQREDASIPLAQFASHYRLFRADGSIYPTEELPVYLALHQGRTTMRDDIVVHRPDGRRIPLVAWAAPVKLSAREQEDAAVWVFEDLTALHQAEAARKDSEGRFRAVIETMAEGLLVIDPMGRISASNPAATLLFGLPTESMRGRPIFELDWHFVREDGAPLPPEDHPVAVARRTGRPVRHAVVGAYPGGATVSPGDASILRWLLCNAMPLGTSGVVLTFSDISTYIQAREAIRLSEERFRGLVETLPLMVLLTDRQMNITYVNPASIALAGYQLGEIQEPSNWMAIIHPSDLPTMQDLFRGVWEGRSGRAEIRYRAKNGQERTSITLIQPRLHADNVVLGAMILLVDVTRERQLEQELQRAQRMEIVGRMASSVAHDFNNWLGVVLNLTDLARTHLPGDHPVVADLHKISEAGEQAAGLAGQLLALTRQRLAPIDRIDLNRAIRNTLDLLRSSLPPSILVESDLAPRSLLIHADLAQIQQVLINLCLNARDAMPHGGLLRLRSQQREGRIELMIQDTGHGMTDAVRSRIFEPFYSTKETGTGLGLAIVMQIVEGYGGTIEVESAPDRGTRFLLSWLAAEPTA